MQAGLMTFVAHCTCFGYLRAGLASLGSWHKRQKAQAPTPQAPIRNRQNEKIRKRQSSYPQY